MCTVNQKSLAAAFVLNQFVGSNAIDTFPNVRLMKLLYFFYLEYASIFDAKGEEMPTNSPFRDFVFTALPKGPVEVQIYGDITNIKELISNGKAPVECPGGDETNVKGAARRVKEWCQNIDTGELVNITHSELNEWKNTELFHVMKFQYGLGPEIHAFHNLRSFSNSLNNRS